MYIEYYKSNGIAMDYKTNSIVLIDQLIPPAERATNFPNIPDNNFTRVWVDEIDTYIKDNRIYAYKGTKFYKKRPGFYR